MAASDVQCDTTLPEAVIIACARGPAPGVSELGQLGARCQDAPHLGAEIDEHGGSVFDTGDRAEAVLIVGDLVIYREPLGRRLGLGNTERTGCQVAPGRGAVRTHCYQYAPAWGRLPP
jgi:hypothetical protein